MDILTTIRRSPAYHLARIWTENLLAYADRPTTKGLRVGIGAVACLFRASFDGRERGRPTIAAALADPHLESALIVALSDLGIEVDEVPQLYFEGKHLACNLRLQVLWTRARTSRPSARTVH